MCIGRYTSGAAPGSTPKNSGGVTPTTVKGTRSMVNVAPTIAISGAGSVNEGSVYSLSLGAITDPGTDTVTSYIVHWGDGNSDTYSTAGSGLPTAWMARRTGTNPTSTNPATKNTTREMIASRKEPVAWPTPAKTSGPSHEVDRSPTS